MANQPLRPVRHRRVGRSAAGALAAGGLAYLAIASLPGLPARLLTACLGWAGAAFALELISIAGFVSVFTLVFGARMHWRQGVPAGLRGLAASALLPAGGLIGPAAAARSALPGDPALRDTIRSAVAFTILTSAPGALVLGGLGLLVWEGAAAGPHTAALTLLPAGLSLSVVLATSLVRESSTQGGDGSQRHTFARLSRHSGPLRGGVLQARQLLASSHWHLVGAAAYYAFDNAVLWATFHAYGHTPPVSVIVMGYLVGSFAGALPVPAGLGVVDGGMIGALVLYGAPAAAAAGAVVLYRAVSLSLALILGAATWHAGSTDQRSPLGGLRAGPEPRSPQVAATRPRAPSSFSPIADDA